MMKFFKSSFVFICLAWAETSIDVGCMHVLFSSNTMKSYASIDDLASEAGAGPDIRKYLSCRGIVAVPTLALTAKNEDEFEKVVLAPLFAGWNDGSTVIKIQPADQPIAKAILTHMWALAKQTWSRALAASPAPTAPTPALTPTGTSGTASTTTSTESKVPKNLPPGTWNSLVKHYQSIQLDGRDRVFPVTELIGAESILARMHHELTISGQYTPILLGEILQKRSFNAAGEVNPLQKSPKKTTTLAVDEDNQIITAEDPVWCPRSMLAILDGINSIRWAFILVRWGEERHVHTYCDWMLSKARSKPQKGENFVAYWQWAGWQLAMAMRNGSTIP